MKSRWMSLQIGVVVFAVAGLALLAARSLFQLSSTPVPDPDADYRAVRVVVARIAAASQAADFERVFFMNTRWTRDRVTVQEYERLMRQRINQMAVSKRIEVGRIEIEGDVASVEIHLVGFQNDVNLGLITLVRENRLWVLENIQVDPVAIEAEVQGSRLQV